MRYLFTCGGTAGHINPALAVADRLRELDQEAAFLFVGASDRMETDLVPRAGYEIRTVDVSYILSHQRAHGIRVFGQSTSQ